MDPVQHEAVLNWAHIAQNGKTLLENQIGIFSFNKILILWFHINALKLTLVLKATVVRP